MATHEHHAGEFGSTRKPGLQKDSAFAIQRARMSVDKAKSALDKRRTSKSAIDRENYAREASRHLDNAEKHVAKATHPTHAVEAKTISDQTAKIHAKVHDHIEKDQKTTESQTPEKPAGTISKVSGSVGAFGAMAIADIRAKKTSDASSHLATAKAHADRAGLHSLSAIGSSDSFEKLRHTTSALTASRSAISSARRVLVNGSDHEKRQAYQIIQHALQTRGEARSAVAASDTDHSREIENRAKYHAASAQSAQNMADNAGSDSERSMHQKVADKHRKAAMKTVEESHKRLEETGEGYGSQESLNELVKTLKRRRSRKKGG